MAFLTPWVRDLTRHGATPGAQQLFALDRAEPGAAWLARYQLRRFPPVTVEQATALREVSAEAARLMPASARAQYGEIVAEALGAPGRILEVDWERHATTARAREMRDRLHRWAFDWAGRLEQTSLAEHLDEAPTLLRAARTELDKSMDNHLPVDPQAREPDARLR